jgi:hypothetical protein
MIAKKDILTLMIALAFCMELVFNWTEVAIFRSPKNIFLLIALFIYIPLAIKKNTIYISSYSSIFIGLMFSLLFIIITTGLLTVVDGDIINQNEVIQYIGSLTIFLIVYNTLDTEIRLRFVLMLGSVFFGISCILAILQYYNFDFAWQIRGLFGFRGGGEVEKQFIARSKPFGLNYYSINFSHTITLIFPYIFSQCFYRNSYQMIYKILFPIYFLALITINVKSAILGVGIYFVIKWVLQKKRTQIVKIIVLIGLLAIISFGWNYYNITQYLSSSTITSFIVRIPLLLMGTIILWNFPFGIDGNIGYHELAKQFLPLIEHLPMSESVLRLAPHNYLLTYGIFNFGIISVLIAILIYTLPLFIALQVKKTTLHFNSIYIQSNALGWGVIVYFVNNMFHNGGPLMGHQLYFFICAIIFKMHILSKNIYQINV